MLQSARTLRKWMNFLEEEFAKDTGTRHRD